MFIPSMILLLMKDQTYSTSESWSQTENSIFNRKLFSPFPVEMITQDLARLQDSNILANFLQDLAAILANTREKDLFLQESCKILQYSSIDILQEVNFLQDFQDNPPARPVFLQEILLDSCKK